MGGVRYHGSEETDTSRPSPATVDVLVALYLVGLFFSDYDPFVVHAGRTAVFRLDWALSIPLVVYLARTSITLTRPALYALAYVCVLVASALVNPVYSSASLLTFLLQTVYAVGLFVAILQIEMTDRRLALVCRVWCLLLFVGAVFTLYQALVANLGLPFPVGFLREAATTDTVGGFTRAKAFSHEPGWLATWHLTGVAILFGSIGTETHLIFDEQTEWVVLVTLLASVLVSGSYSGYLSLLALSGLAVLLPSTRDVAAPLVGTFGMIATGVVALVVRVRPAYVEFIFRRTATLVWSLSSLFTSGPTQFSGSIGARLAGVVGGLIAWRSNPLFGVGPGQLEAWQLNQPGTNAIASVPGWGGTHNYWIQILGTSGVFGLVTIVLLWRSVVLGLGETYRSGNRFQRALATIGVLLVGLQAVDSLWGVQSLHPIRWVFLGFLAAYVKEPTPVPRLGDWRSVTLFRP